MDDLPGSEGGDEGAQLAVAERVVLAAAAQKLRDAALMIEGDWHQLPSDEVVTGAGVMAADATGLLESVFAGRVAARGQGGES